MEFRCAFSLIVVAIMALAIATSGCGGSSDDGGNVARAEGDQVNQTKTEGSQDDQVKAKGSQEFDAMLLALRTAAASDQTYHAYRRARTLKSPVERTVVQQFCYLAWQVGINHEELKLNDRAYAVDRLIDYAGYKRSSAFAVSATAAVNELQTIIDLKSLKGEQLKSYIKPCYRTN